MMRFMALTCAAAILAVGPAAHATTRPATTRSASGLAPAQRAAIDRYVVREMTRQRIPGLELGVYRHGRPVLVKGYGLADVEWKVPATGDTLMQSGSVGKQFAATALMMLVEEGKVGLDDAIATYFPGAPDSWKAIRVKNLLSHTSGLAEYEEGDRAKPGGPFDLRLDFTDAELLAKVQALPIEHAPGDHWDYRNTNYLLLGLLIEKVTGRFYGDVLHDRIFAPLGMTSTRVISDADIIPKRAHGYEIKGGELKNQAYVSRTFNRTADGTLYFTVADLQKWDAALYGERLLKRASLERMWTPFVMNDGRPNASGYGFGWMMGEVNGRRTISHTGSWQGFTTVINRHVDDGLTVVVLANLDAGHARPDNIERVVAGMIVPALQPKPRPPIADDAPAIAETARRVLNAAAAGRDVKALMAAEAGYTFLSEDGPELRASLPAGWDREPMPLLRRRTSEGVTQSLFRIGPAGARRNLAVQTDAEGRLLSWSVRPDPDAR